MKEFEGFYSDFVEILEMAVLEVAFLRLVLQFCVDYHADGNRCRFVLLAGGYCYGWGCYVVRGGYCDILGDLVVRIVWGWQGKFERAIVHDC